MRPPNTVAYPIHDLLQKRWSPRAFDANRPVEPNKLLLLLEAARWTPSSFNAQPWSFLVSRRDDPATFQPMLDCLMEKNQAWARNAPILMIAVASTLFSHNGKPNLNGPYDTGAAVANPTLEATAQDLYVHQMAGFDAAKARQTYAIPETATPMAALAIGYLGDPQQLPDDLREREQAPSARKPVSEFTFAGKWASPAAWAADTH
jgi:nitroreductase